MLIITSTPQHALLKSLLSPVSVFILQLWSWAWRMEPTPVRGDWKWSIKENGAQWMITTGAWRRQLWCADRWGVEVLLVLPKGLNLDQELDLFGFIILTAKGRSQLSPNVVILLWKTNDLRAIPMARMLEQSAQVKSCLVQKGIPNRRSFSLIPRITMRIWITALEHSWVKIPLSQWCLQW